MRFWIVFNLLLLFGETARADHMVLHSRHAGPAPLVLTGEHTTIGGGKEVINETFKQGKANISLIDTKSLQKIDGKEEEKDKVVVVRNGHIVAGQVYLDHHEVFHTGNCGSGEIRSEIKGIEREPIELQSSPETYFPPFPTPFTGPTGPPTGPPAPPPPQGAVPLPSSLFQVGSGMVTLLGVSYLRRKMKAC